MKGVVVYWSQTGNTENMANGVLDGMLEGGSQATLRRVEDITAQEVTRYDKIALGCPAMGNEALEELEFEPFFSELEPLIKGKDVAIFGSFGWGEGEWMEDWEERVKAAGATLYSGKGLPIQENSDSIYEESFMFGKAFVSEK